MHFSQSFPPEAAGVASVRQFVRSHLCRFTDREEPLEAVVLLASELAANVVEHARTPYTVSLDVSADLVRVELCDGNAVEPAARTLVDPEAEDGRGLMILALVAAEWGVTALAQGGKAVWFVAPLR